MVVQSKKQYNTGKRGVLIKSVICREIVINEFTSGMSLAEIARKYNRSSARIWQIIRTECDKEQFHHLRIEQKANRKASRLKDFMDLTVKLERIPCLFEAKAALPGIHLYYNDFKEHALQNGYVYNTDHIHRGRARTFTENKLIDHLKKLAVKLGHTPSCREINKEGKFTHNMYITSFGSVQNAQELAGLSPNRKYNSIENARRTKHYVTKDLCLEDIRRIHNEVGGTISLAQLREYGRYPFSKYYSRLGGVKKIRTLPELQDNG